MKMLETYRLSYDPEGLLSTLDPVLWCVVEALQPSRRTGSAGAFAIRKTFEDHPSGVGLYMPVFVLDHIATGRSLFRGSDAGCEAAARSLETMPVNWAQPIEPESLSQEQQEFCSRVITMAANRESSVEWAETEGQV